MPTLPQARPNAGMAFRGSSPKPSFRNNSWLTNQILSAGEGALDTVTLGLDDVAVSGAQALYDAAHGKSLAQAYRDRIAYQHARDQYDKEHYGNARLFGEVAGTLVPLGATGPLAAGARLIGKTAKFTRFGKAFAQAERIGNRIKQVTPLAGRERVAVSGLGGVSGGVSQAVSDIENRRLSSLGDYAGAVAGGAVQAQLALHGRAKLAGAGGGAATSVLQDVFNQRPVSWERAAQEATFGGLAGAAGDLIGRGRFYRRGISPDGRTGRIQTNKDKELMGEAFSKIRTRLRGDRTASTEKKWLPLEEGGHTIPDQLTEKGEHVESKAGIWARLTPRQIQAFLQKGLNYRVDHFLPKDLGSFTGFLAAQGGLHLPDYFGQDPSRQDGVPSL